MQNLCSVFYRKLLIRGKREQIWGIKTSGNGDRGNERDSRDNKSGPEGTD